MHYDEIEDFGEILANVRSFGMSNENLLHQDEFLMVWRILDNGCVLCGVRGGNLLPQITKLCVKRQNNIN